MSIALLRAGSQGDRIYTDPTSSVKIIYKYVDCPDRFRHEVEMMRRALSETCVRLLGEDIEQRLIAMEKYDCDLFDYCSDPIEFEKIKLEIPSVVKQLVDGLIYIHSTGISHRDIKPENIFMKRTSGGLKAVYGDFGLSCFTKTSQNERRGSAVWIAPEVLSTEPYETDLTDWWSLGLVIYLLFTKFPVFDINPDDKVTAYHRNLFLRYLREVGWPNLWTMYYFKDFKLSVEEKELIEALICVDPAYRASDATVKTLSYFIEA